MTLDCESVSDIIRLRDTEREGDGSRNDAAGSEGHESRALGLPGRDGLQRGDDISVASDWGLTMGGHIIITL